MTIKSIDENLNLRIKAAILMVAVLVLFGIGIFSSRMIDGRLTDFVKDGQDQLKKKYGITLVIGHAEAGLGSLTLSEVSVGSSGWLVVDRIYVSVSLNPFRDFLRPSSVTMGKAVIKLPWRRELWPAELELFLNSIRSRSSTAQETSFEAKSSVVRLIPRILELKAARVEVSDGLITKILAERLNIKARFFDKRIGFGADHVQVLDLFNEFHIEGEVKNLGREGEQIFLSGREAKEGESAWKVDCNLNREKMSAKCRADANRLPQSLVGPVQRYLGSGFAPSFQGVFSVSKAGLDRSVKAFNLDLEGQFGKIFIEHPSLALTPVGPSFIKTKVNVLVNLDQKNIKIQKSSAELLATDPVKSTIPQDALPLEFQGDLTLSKNDEGKSTVTGVMNLDVPLVSCQTGLNAVPKSFIPDLEGVKLGGTATLHFKANIVEGISQLSIKDSKFDCVASEIPEIFSASYLSSPFNIERNLPDGKIYIPVDPARPYFTSYKDIPSLVRSAFVSSEDAGFFQHKGVEISAIVGAVERNAEQGRAAFGGSTITMQTVKNLFLARDKTISRKAQEVFLAWHIERTISKERILEIYLNMVEFGPGLYGIGLASQRFFDKKPKNLTLKQSIYLASLLPAPVPRYRYFCKGQVTQNYNRILRQLLDRMLGLGRISVEQHAEALAEPIVFSAVERETACGKSDIAESDADLQSERSD